ncbi:MAG: DUF1223 domain-containing protein [Candidatus Thiodiazotropha sp. (ex Rostrolucina anterorostrata)]|nr:DUF1223 domain-containing protein [Candidatus Thiodiazotropha sp. (ex Rostrolucina anterorostrata)]
MNRWAGLLLFSGLMALMATQPVYSLTLQSPVERVNLLELYTSHGCSSCPPADAWLRTLEDHPGLWQQLIPMAFHVDYWDDLGWSDRFASTAFSKRQRDYRHSGAINSVYTPGFVFNGDEWRGWFRRSPLDLQQTERVGRLSLQVDPGKGVVVQFTPQPHLNGIKLRANLAILGFGLSSSIGGGENRGRMLDESFVVLSHSQTEVQDGYWHFKWPEQSVKEAKKLALVAWLSRPGSDEPVQAAGGWLP